MTKEKKTECRNCRLEKGEFFLPLGGNPNYKVGTQHQEKGEAMTEEKKTGCGNCDMEEGEYHADWCCCKPNYKVGSKAEDEAFKFLEAMYEANDGDAVPIPEAMSDKDIRTFASGATRDALGDKHDYEGFLSPWAIRRYGEYMHSHRIQADGKLRASDNWQKGIPIDQYMKSLFRHTLDAWSIHRGLRTCDAKDGEEIGIEDALCGVIFNAFGFLHERLRATDNLFVGLLRNHHKETEK